MSWTVWRRDQPHAQWRKAPTDGTEEGARAAFARFLRQRAFAVMELRREDGTVVSHVERTTARDRTRSKGR